MDKIQDVQLFFSQPWIEWLAAISGIASVWFAKKENILVYPVGLISVGLYIFICLFAELYADAFINLYYLFISVYGWYYWIFGGRLLKNVKTNTELKARIIKSSLTERLFFIALTFLLYFALGYLLSNFTNSNVPWIDSMNTSMFIIAMYLMAKKNIDHWWYWIVGNCVSIPLYIYKDLYITSIQYFIFLLIALSGYDEWHKKLHGNVNKSN